MCPPNKIVQVISSELLDALRVSDSQKINEVLIKYSHKYILFFNKITLSQLSDPEVMEKIPQSAPGNSTYLGVVIFIPELWSKEVKPSPNYKFIRLAEEQLRQKTMDLNKNKCLNQTLFMKNYEVNDGNLYYFCLFLKEGETCDFIPAWVYSDFISKL